MISHIAKCDIIFSPRHGNAKKTIIIRRCANQIRFAEDICSNKFFSSLSILNISTDSIDWGNQDSDQQGLAAPGNPYQVGLDENSNDAAGLYIKGTDLTGSTSTPIEVSNISWCNGCSGYVTSTRMNNSYQLIQSSPPSGVTYSTYFWLDTPPVYYGQYTGSITIMANASW